MLALLMLVVAVMLPKPPKTDRCLACDLGVHRPGRKVRGCNCGDCGSGTKQG